MARASPENAGFMWPTIFNAGFAALLAVAGTAHCALVPKKNSRIPTHLEPGEVPPKTDTAEDFQGMTFALMPAFGLGRREFNLPMQKTVPGRNALTRSEPVRWQASSAGLSLLVLGHSRFYGFWLGYASTYGAEIVHAGMGEPTGLTARGGGGYFSHVQMLGYRLRNFRLYLGAGPRAGINATVDQTSLADGFSLSAAPSFYLHAALQAGILYRYRWLLLHVAYSRTVFSANSTHVFSDDLALGLGYAFF